jgi:hypothetical protein
VAERSQLGCQPQAQGGRCERLQPAPYPHKSGMRPCRLPGRPGRSRCGLAWYLAGPRLGQAALGRLKSWPLLPSILVTARSAGPPGHASAGELFGIVAGPHSHGEPGGCGTVVGTAGGPRRLAQDARFLVKMKQYGVPYRITSRVTDQAVMESPSPAGRAAAGRTVAGLQTSSRNRWTSARPAVVRGGSWGEVVGAGQSRKLLTPALGGRPGPAGWVEQCRSMAVRVSLTGVVVRLGAGGWPCTGCPPGGLPMNAGGGPSY